MEIVPWLGQGEISTRTVASGVQPDVTNLIGTRELCSHAQPTFIGCYSLQPTASTPPPGKWGHQAVVEVCSSPPEPQQQLSSLRLCGRRGKTNLPFENHQLFTIILKKNYLLSVWAYLGSLVLYYLYITIRNNLISHFNSRVCCISLFSFFF